jgi:hypothetical protein
MMFRSWSVSLLGAMGIGDIDLALAILNRFLESIGVELGVARREELAAERDDGIACRADGRFEHDVLNGFVEIGSCQHDASSR